MRKTMIAAVAAAILGFGLAPGIATAGDAETGAAKVRSKGCITCHGRDGRGTMPLYPNLAGQSEPYLEQQLKAFRSGARTGQQMSIVAKPLSDDDIADLAAYYAGLDPCAGK